MKIVYKLLVAIALLAGCGSMDENSPEELGRLWAEQGMDPEIQIGSLQQALTVPGGYGINPGNQSRCGSLTGCIIPKSKTYKFHNKTSNCSGSNAQVLKDQAAAAMQNLRTILENRGFTVTVDTANASPIPQQTHVDVTFLCGTDTGGLFPNPINIAGTSPNCISDGSPSPCRLYNATVRMNHNDMDYIFSQNPTATSTQKGKFALNVWAHELGHTVAFGHNPTFTGTQVMFSGAGMALSGDPSTWTNRSYTNEEKGWLASFVP